MTALCIFLTFACLLASLFRARWVALALAPPVLLILTRWTGLVDISSASHPLRFWVPIMSLSMAMWAGWYYAHMRQHWRDLRRTNVVQAHDAMIARIITGYVRALYASIIVFASGCTDIPALLTWKLPGEWALVPLQILACAAVLTVLFVPERWVSRWLR